MRRMLMGAAAAAGLVMIGGSANLAQSAPAGIEPHLAKALAIAAEEQSWRHSALLSCYPYEGQAAENAFRDSKGYKVFDNLYYVGSAKYGPYAIDTPDGIILIDAMNNRDEVDKYILANMRNVGLDPARLKVLIISHGHADHFGGAKYVQDKFGVRVYMTDTDYDWAAKRPERSDQGPLPKRDRSIKDGDTISFGGENIKAYLTPGHTPAALTMLIPVKDHGKPRLLAYFGGLTSKGLSPEWHKTLDASYGRMIQIASDAKVDGYIATHPDIDDTIYKNESNRSNLANPDATNAFLPGTAATLRYLRIERECNLHEAWLDAAKHYKGGNVAYK